MDIIKRPLRSTHGCHKWQQIKKFQICPPFVLTVTKSWLIKWKYFHCLFFSILRYLNKLLIRYIIFLIVFFFVVQFDKFNSIMQHSCPGCTQKKGIDGQCVAIYSWIKLRTCQIVQKYWVHVTKFRQGLIQSAILKARSRWVRVWAKLSFASGGMLRKRSFQVSSFMLYLFTMAVLTLTCSYLLFPSPYWHKLFGIFLSKAVRVQVSTGLKATCMDRPLV